MKEIALCALLLAAGTAAHAAGLEAPAASESIDSVTLLDNVEITANRATAKTPVAFTNVSKEKLTAANDGRDITYLLQLTPSITVTSDAGTGIGYTSMRVRGSDPTRINITANGVPINDPESHSVYWVNMPDLASSLRDVQVQRGAGTSTNGAAAFGASINMVTDIPSRRPYGEISGSYGSYNSNRETLRVGSGLLGDHWSLDAKISHTGSKGYIDRASSELWGYFGQAAYESSNTLVRALAFGGKERTYMAWDYASKEQMEEFGRRYNPCGEYTDSDGNRAYYPNQYDYFTQHHLQLLLTQGIGNYCTLNAAIYYTYDNGHYEQYKTNRTLREYGLTPWVDADGETVKKSDLVRLKFNRNDFGGVNLNFNFHRNRLNATAGVAVSDFIGRHFGQVAWVRNYVGPIEPLQEYYRNTGHKLDVNTFVRATYDISSKFSAFADLQYRHIRYTIKGITDNWDWNSDALAGIDVHRNWNFFNPKVGVNFESGPHRAFASWSVAHREPVRDNFTDGDPHSYPEAERLDDFELGYTFTSGIFSASANLYYMLYHDQLVLTGQLSDTGNPLSVNVPDSYRMGIELQAALKPCNWFDWQANLTLSRNRIKNFTEYIYEDEWTNPISFHLGETPISFSPDVIFNTFFNFHYAGFDASLQGRFVGKQYMNNARSEEAKLDPYFVSDLHLGYTFPKLGKLKELKLGFSIYNLFNKKYFNNGYAGAGYYMDAGEPVIYRYAGFAAQAPIHFAGTISIRL